MRIISLFKKTITAAALLLAASVSAMAVDVTATNDLNVRTGPGTSFGIIDTLDAGEVVNTTECQSSGWCYIEQSGPNGWVSSSYLAPIAPPGSGSSPADCELKLTITASGPKLEVICGDSGSGGSPTPPPPAPAGDEACFYRNANYGGAHFCYGVGELNSLDASFNDRISSVKLNGAAKARLCVNNNLGGFCFNITSDKPVLGPLINNRASSLKVYTSGGSGVVIPVPLPMPIPIPLPIPLPAPITPTTFKTGSISIASSFTADLDTGTTGGSGADIWHHAINAAVRRLEPLNGAQIALGDGTNRGYAGCSTEAYSSSPLPFSSLLVGTYVCVKTSEGRISQFRVNSYAGTSMKIGFTTFAH